MACHARIWRFVREPAGESNAAGDRDRTRDIELASVEDYILSRASEQQRVTQHSPKMWGPSIVGYGSYRYTY